MDQRRTVARTSKSKRETPVVAGAADVQRSVLVVLVVLLPLVFSSAALEPFGIAKWALVAMAAGAILAAQVTRTVCRGALSVPSGSGAAIIGLLAVALVAAATRAGWGTDVVIGAYGRDSGFVLYASCLVIFVLIGMRFDGSWLERLFLAFLAGATLLALVAVLQRMGSSLVPFEVQESSGANGTMANPNFTSGYLAVALGPAIWALTAADKVAARIAAALVLALLLAGLLSTSSLQGLVAAAAAVGAAGFVLLLTSGRVPRRILLPAAAVAAVAAAAVVGLGLGGAGPLAALGEGSAFASRRWFWEAAVKMWRDHPLLGVGLDQYGGWYRAYRPLEAVLGTRVGISNDAAHNVPLMMLSGGGVVLGAAYLAFVVFTGWRILASRVELDAPKRALLAGAAAGWLAYHVQSLVSIDVPPLAVSHFVMAGVAVAVTGGFTRKTFQLPYATAHAKRGAFPLRQTVGVALSVLLLLVSTVAALRPVRADVAAGRGARLLAADRHAESVPPFSEARKLLPGRALYHVQRGGALYGAGMLEPAMESFVTAATLEPRSFEAAQWVARTAAQQGTDDLARLWYSRGLQIEPLHPHFKLEVAQFEAAAGNVEEAREYVAEALEIAPDDPELLEFRDSLAAASNGDV